MREGLRIYNLFPLLAGPIAAWRAHLPRIAAMDFNAVYVNPFHAAGFSGSLYAVKDFYALDPRFRGTASRSDDALIAGFAETCADHRLRPMMDLVINHVSRDSPLIARHPGWFARDPGGDVRSPSAIDPADSTKVTVWGDLAAVDYRGPHQDEVVAYFCGVVRHYAELGFRGFRCDAAYQVPAQAWRTIIAAARALDPDIVFCAETLGARLEEVRQLDGAGFDYLFNSAKWWDFESPWLLEQYATFRSIAPSIAFPESHDTPRLVETLAADGIVEPAAVEAAYRQAYGFAAAFSTGVLMPMGFEFGWGQQLDVVHTRPEPAEPRRFDISPYIAAINAAKRDTPALNVEGPQSLIDQPGAVTALARSTEDGGEWAFTAVDRGTEPATLDCDALLGAAAPDLVLADITPHGFGDGSIGLELRVAPGSLRLLRGERPPLRVVPARPARGAVLPADWAPEARIVVETVYPELDGGRFPVKRVIGDTLEVWADIFRDGHDVIAAALLVRPDGAEEWREAPMRFFDNDRWVGRSTLSEIGRWRYTIEAWTDDFASWRADAIKKRDAGQDIALELAEGYVMLVDAAERAAGADATLLRALLSDYERRDARGRARLLLSRLAAGTVARWQERRLPTRYRRELEITVDRPLACFGAWYELFPRSQGKVPGRSATFDEAAARLPKIAAMGFDVIYLPPIHPIGRINRKGRDNSLVAGPDDPGSPYAIGSAEGGHDAVHPELGGIAGFRRFVDAARAHGLEIALDFAIQCAPDHPWVREHPEWFVFRPDGTIKFAENPPKKYQDIVNVDFYCADRERLWAALRDVVLHWIGEGVRIFRVDNPHTKPLPFWEWLIRDVQHKHPDTIFLAEAFTRPKMLRALAKAGFTQSYSYFTWRTGKDELTEYLTELAQDASKEYLRPNFFANTPDILSPFLQRGGRPAFLIRLVLAATLAGNYGIYSGFELCEATAVPGTEEYLHSEKYEYKVWDWDRPGHIKQEIAHINRIRRDNPALHRLVNLRFYRADDPQILFYGKATEDRRNVVLVAVNLDPFAAHETELHLPLRELGIAENETFAATELLTGQGRWWSGGRQRIVLDPQINPAAIFRIAR
jgi:starch synthase (maltosyl-transferring)